ncbi:MAG: glycoside hydrolase family 76 protein [Verrucomicrobiae bacterium]|nr:glycoside hydrolase family 76 protein [Verrucomicrobiae bacterium]
MNAKMDGFKVRATMAGTAGLLLMLVLSATQAAAGTNSKYWTNAQCIHGHILDNFHATNGSYRIQPGSSTAYEWYNVSQIYADSTMVSEGASTYATWMNGTFSWMNQLWDAGDTNGGYFASANTSGTGAGGGKYVDDNSLAGNVYLDCYAITTGVMRTNYLKAAIATAKWLACSGQWDDKFGGGFWWDGTKQNKPTQSNGLAMQLFLRLYQITGQTDYRDWANRVKSWLESRMFDAADGLYVWQITTNGTTGGFKDLTEFTYDNAIMIEADLLYSQITTNPLYEIKAQTLARQLNARLWDNTYGSYGFNTKDRRVNPTWCGWASQSLIKLYEVDGDTNWLNYAQRNIDFINRNLADKAGGGFYVFCDMDGSRVDNRKEGVDQSWMQKIQAMMSRYR